MLFTALTALPVFATGLGLVIFDATYFVWFGSEIVGALLIPRLRGRGTTRVRRDRGSAALILLTVWVSLGIALAFGYGGVARLSDWVFYLGIFLMLLGIGLRQWAIAVLGRFFSLNVRVVEEHKVVDKGPYRWVRHPSYTGLLITFIGLSLAVQSLGALLVLLVVFTVSFGYRIRVEERTLLTELGDSYASYMKRTKRLIPYLI
jgi:protein-S-isoprenylcysteine O-methyltransferase Ste14